jgi:Tol biopolymer transport system component
LQPSSILHQSAFAAFPGENGKIAFSSTREGDAEIYVMNEDGTGFASLTNNDVPDYLPSWSPDGTKIAFTGSFGRSAEIYVMNADGSEQTRLTNNAFADYSPRWSPDGTKLAFESDRDAVGNELVEVYVMNADGSEQTRLTNNPGGHDQNPSWSPDGRSIVFASQRDDSQSEEIYVMNADGSEQTRLTNNPGPDVEPDWSPDGRSIVFANYANGDIEIYVMNADGSEQIQLASDDGNRADYSPRWSPDGTKIVYGTSIEHRNGEIYVMNADGSEQTNISNNPASDSSPDWGSTGAPPPDTTLPVITVPEDMTVEATSPDGAQVTFEEEPSAIDEVDGPVDVTCDYSSGDTFPIGETVVTCSAEDEAGNSAEEKFTVTVQDNTAPDVEITQVADRRNRVLQEGDTTPTPYIRVTFEVTDAVGVENTECSIDGQPFASCTSPVVYDRLSRGTHQVTVRATDEAGNTGEDRFLFTVGSPSSSAAAPPGGQ